MKNTELRKKALTFFTEYETRITKESKLLFIELLILETNTEGYVESIEDHRTFLKK